MRFLPEVWRFVISERDWMLGISWIPYYSTVDRFEDELEPDRRWYWTIQEIHMTIAIMAILEKRNERMYYQS